MLQHSLKAVGAKKALQDAKGGAQLESLEGGEGVQKKRTKASSKKNAEKQKSKGGVNDKKLTQANDEIQSIEDSKKTEKKSAKQQNVKHAKFEEQGSNQSAKAQGEILKEPKQKALDPNKMPSEHKGLETFEEPIKPAEEKTQDVKSQVMQEKRAKNPLAQTLLSAEMGAEINEEIKKEKKSSAQKVNAKKAKAEAKAQENALTASKDDVKFKPQNEDMLNIADEQEALGSEEMTPKTQKRKAQKHKNDEESTESKSASQSNKHSGEVSGTQSTQRTQILYRSHLARESVRNFAQSLREEIINYKPPVTKLSMELNPQNLGSLELTISKKGKDLHIQVVSNATAIGLFVQNQADFKANLSQMGFENVDLSFSSNDGGGGKRESDNQGQASQGNEEEGNKNSLEDSQTAMQMNIVLPRYA